MRIHYLASLFSLFSLQFQIVSNIVRMLFRYISFTCFSAYPNRLKYRQNTCFRDFAFNFSLRFQIVSNTVRMHALELSFSFLSLQFQIVSNTVRLHALETFCLKSSAFPNRFKYRQNACLSDIVFKIRYL